MQTHRKHLGENVIVMITQLHSQFDEHGINNTVRGESSHYEVYTFVPPLLDSLHLSQWIPGQSGLAVCMTKTYNTHYTALSEQVLVCVYHCLHML